MAELAGFETTSLRMEAMLRLGFQAPPEDVERIMGGRLRPDAAGMGKI